MSGFVTTGSGVVGFGDLELLEKTKGSGYPFTKEYDEPSGVHYYKATDVRVVERWVDLAERVAREQSVPVAWILAMIYAESRGDEKAEAPDGGWGLMQITHDSFKRGRTKEQVFEPYTNLTLGAGAVARYIRANPDIYNLPEAASCYNAGARPGYRPWPSDVSPWFMRETKGHISRVVAANNGIVAMLKDAACR